MTRPQDHSLTFSQGRKAEANVPDVSGLSDYADAFSIPREQQQQEQQLENEQVEWDLQHKNAGQGDDGQPFPPDLGQDEYPEVSLFQIQLGNSIISLPLLCSHFIYPTLGMAVRS